MSASQIRNQIDFIDIIKYQPSNLASRLVTTKDCQPHAKNILKNI